MAQRHPAKYRNALEEAQLNLTGPKCVRKLTAWSATCKAEPGIYATAATAVLALVNNNTTSPTSRKRSLRHTAVNTDAAVVFDALPGQNLPGACDNSDAGILAGGREAVNGQLSPENDPPAGCATPSGCAFHVALDQPLLDKPLPTGARATVQLYNGEDLCPHLRRPADPR